MNTIERTIIVLQNKLIKIKAQKANVSLIQITGKEKKVIKKAIKLLNKIQNEAN